MLMKALTLLMEPVTSRTKDSLATSTTLARNRLEISTIWERV